MNSVPNIIIDLLVLHNRLLEEAHVVFPFYFLVFTIQEITLTGIYLLIFCVGFLNWILEKTYFSCFPLQIRMFDLKANCRHVPAVWSPTQVTERHNVITCIF
jgi:hypothetical protein